MNTTATTIAPSDVLISSVVLEFCAQGWDGLATKIAFDYTGIDIESYDEVYLEQHRQFWTKTMTIKEIETCVRMYFNVSGNDYDNRFGPHVNNIVQRSETEKKNNAILYR